MGLYLKGMTRPESCFECHLTKWLDKDSRAGCLIDDEVRNASRPSGCPLIEVKEPHGRLIDADAYCKDLTEQSNIFRELLKPETIERINRTLEDLRNYQAVIEAEGSEDE